MDGVDVTQIDPADLRRNIGYVSQDYSLLYGSVHSNISLSAPWANDQAILQAAKIANVDRFDAFRRWDIDYLWSPRELADLGVVDANIRPCDAIVEELENARAEVQAAKEYIEGLVTRARDLRDRRSLRLVMTKKGKELFEQAVIPAWELVQHTMSCLSEEELQTLCSLRNEVLEWTKKILYLKISYYLQQFAGMSRKLNPSILLMPRTRILLICWRTSRRD